MSNEKKISLGPSPEQQRRSLDRLLREAAELADVTMYTLEVEIEVAAPGKDEYYHPMLEITYTYVPPNLRKLEPAEVWLIDASILNAEPDCEPAHMQVMKWAEDWLLGPGFYQACEYAEEQLP